MTTIESKATSGQLVSFARPGFAGPFRTHVIGAVFRRNLQSYFSNPAGYVFITLFVLISSCVAFWQDSFFANNLANLDALNRYMPYLLLFFIPAITMSTWADERRQGTDELLLTLPAHDVDVVLGKYLAAVGIYTVALVFSLPMVIILRTLGPPDLGVAASTYLGYWLMGALLIAVGMTASLLSSNVTVAFILGAVFCSIPIFLGVIGSPAGASLRRRIEDWSIPAQFQPFGSGVITSAGIFYFVGLSLAMLYLNMVLLGRRHWAGGEKSAGRWIHSVVRVVAVVVSLVSATALLDRYGLRADASSEHMHTLSKETLEMLKQLPADRPILIQTYYSPEVPRDYVEVKTDLVGLLKEYEARSGGKIQLNLVPTEVFSEEAREAQKRFGIEPRRVMSLEGGKQSTIDIFLGVAFTSGVEEVVVPFFDRGLPVEYELTRSIRVVSKSNRKKVGILSTDAKMMGGFDMQSFNQTPEWMIVTELKKQYELSSVSADSPVPAEIDVLLAAQPSSLTQKQIDNLTDYVKKGGATLLFLDPLPISNVAISPEMPRQSPGGPFGGGPPPEPKGNLRPLLDLVGLEWPSVDIVWNPYNPHPKLDLQATPEIVFIGRGGGAADAFNPNQVASSELQDLVMLFPGLLRPSASGGGTEFVPLLRTSPMGGTIMWSEVTTQQGFMGGRSLNPRRHWIPSGTSYTLAARVTGSLPAEAPKPDPATKDDAAKKAEKPQPAAKANVIAIADLDMISDLFFGLRQRKEEDLDFDNVPFVLNCVDVLAGDESFVNLRKRRPKHRTLVSLEAQTSQFNEELQTVTKQAEAQAAEELQGAQKSFDKEVEQVRGRTDWDERTKEIQLANLQDVAQRRLDVKKQVVEDKKQERIREGRAETERKIRQIQNSVRFAAAAFPPLPPLVLGLLVWLRRLSLENRGANPKRLA